MADDFISRKEAYKTLTEYYHHTTQTMHDALQEALDRVPSADVAPVRHGRWAPYARRGICGLLFSCSECNAKYDGTPNYCPNCGAKMDKSE